ncbi:MAG: hypothetical protein IT431_14645 [Phycisphaerales bacterium]|nr:hypothetical protein [Phycisphaerales bacterium]
MAKKLLNEIDALAAINETMESLPDDQSRVRVLEWAISKFQLSGSMSTTAAPRVPVGVVGQSSGTPQTAATPGELGDIIHILDDGSIKVVARDLKAASANDAAVRLAHVVVYCVKHLLNGQKASSKVHLVPVLRDWRCYNGNTRGALAKEKGMIREGDALSLDQLAARRAEEIIAEIRNTETEGKWKGGTAAKKQVAKNKTGAAKKQK